MLKRQFSEVKNVLMILLAVFFVATLTIATASAATSNATTSTEGLQKSSTNSQEIQGSVGEVTQLEQINAALQKGPVLLEFGADWCTYCHEMKPILQELATEYKGKATVMSADVDKSPKLVEYFGVEDGVPDSTVIVGIENNKYVYMQEDGKVSKDRSNARIMGLTDKQEFENVLDLALGDTSVQDLDLSDTNVQDLNMNDINVQNPDLDDTSAQDLNLENTNVQDLDLDDTSVPVADFTSNTTEGYSPLTVQFIDKSTGSPTSWSWDFGDGTTSTVQNPTHTYSKAGNYTVTLTAENTAGSTTVTDSSFIVLASAKTPTDACSISPITGNESLSVKLNDTGTSNSTSCTWKCDDGNTLTAQNPSDKCTKKGTYTVSLTVKKHDCCCKRK